MSGCRNHTIWFEDTEQVLIAQAQDAAGRQSAERLDAGADQRGPLVAAEGFDRDGIGHQLPGVVRREDQAGEALGHGRAGLQRHRPVQARGQAGTCSASVSYRLSRSEVSMGST